MSLLEEMFVFQLKAVGMPDPGREFKFHPDRRWRLDFYWETGWAVEINGGGWVQGRHNRNALTMRKEYEKLNACLEQGIRVLQYTGEQVKTGEAILQVQRIFNK